MTAVIDGRPAAPCVGSGYCCRTAPCPLGTAKHGPVAPCPSLVYDADAGRHWCGEVVNAPTEAERERVKAMLYVGEGCCSPLNSDRRPILARLRAKGNAA